MKIHDERKQKTASFGTLMYGRTFYYPAEEFHAMKIFEVKDEDESPINAVDLGSGTLFFVGACEEVIPTICSLHIVE